MSVFDCQQYIGLIPTINVLCGELFPTKIRATANGIVMATTYIAFMVNLKIYPIAVAAFAFHYVMYFYAAMMAFMVVWGGLTIKYTDKLSLTEIQDMHKKTNVCGIATRNRDEPQEKEDEVGNQKGYTNSIEMEDVGKVVFKQEEDNKKKGKDWVTICQAVENR